MHILAIVLLVIILLLFVAALGGWPRYGGRYGAWGLAGVLIVVLVIFWLLGYL